MRGVGRGDQWGFKEKEKAGVREAEK